MKYSTTLIAGLIFMAMTACQKSDDEGSQVSSIMQSQDILTFEGVDSLESFDLTIPTELKEAFCVHAYMLPLKSDFNEELATLCTDGLPNETFDKLDRFAKLVGDEPRSLKFEIQHEGNRSKGLFATVYELPIQPKWIRSADIGSFMVKESTYDYMQQTGFSINFDGDVGGDLQFGKSTLEYEATVETPDGQTFSNQRRTELNSYQVQGGNSNIGMGAEHLVSSEDDAYLKYNTVTVTIGTESDGSVLITIINLDVNNNEFPALAEQVMSDIATAQATHVRNNLWNSLQDHVIE